TESGAVSKLLVPRARGCLGCRDIWAVRSANDPRVRPARAPSIQENSMTQQKDPTDGRPEEVAAKQQKIQKQQDQKDQKDAAKSDSEGSGESGAVQTGARDHPAPPLPAQRLEKPGLEQDMTLAPQFLAPAYKGSGK